MSLTSADVCMIGPIAVPVTAAVAIFLGGDRGSGPLGLAAAAVTAAAVGGLTGQVWRAGPLSYSVGGWGAPVGIDLHADGLSCVMLAMTALVANLVSWYAWSYFAPRAAGAAPAEASPGTPAAQYWGPWLLLWGALNALFLSADIFNLYVALELLTLAAVGLVSLAGGAVAVAAALRYLLAALAGSLLYLTGVALLYGALGTLDLALLAQRMDASGPVRAALVLMTIGLLLKTALFPLHFWLPPAHGSAPAPVSAALSALVVKGSFYLLARLWFDVFPAELTAHGAPVLAWLGGAAIVWGSLQALCAARLKMLIAYSTVAQLGYLFLMFALADRHSAAGQNAWSAAMLLALSHACAKAALFLAAGVILHVAGHDHIRGLATVGPRLPRAFFAMGVAAVSLMGLPPSASFAAKWLLLTTALASGQFLLAAVLLAGGLLAAAYLFRVLPAAFAPPTADAAAPSTAADRWQESVALTLAVVGLLLGLAAAPLIDLLAIGSPWSRLPGGGAPP